MKRANNYLVSAEANLRGKLSRPPGAVGGGSQNQVVVRFWLPHHIAAGDVGVRRKPLRGVLWIITMTLVLVGLSTLKLR